MRRHLWRKVVVLRPVVGHALRHRAESNVLHASAVQYRRHLIGGQIRYRLQLVHHVVVWRHAATVRRRERRTLNVGRTAIVGRVAGRHAAVVVHRRLHVVGREVVVEIVARRSAAHAEHAGTEQWCRGAAGIGTAGEHVRVGTADEAGGRR